MKTTAKDIRELSRRLKLETCTITRIAGAYVDAEKNIITRFNETFLNMEDTEMFKYLNIIKKIYSTKIDEKMLTLEFDPADLKQTQEFLQQLTNGKLKDEAAVDEMIDKIICNYDYMGNYLILLLHDAYDILKYTSDNGKLDESEEVYEYIQCIICPVSLEKPGLEYNEEENAITPINRDWIVGNPNVAFIYPAFIDRSADRDRVMYYTKDATCTHKEIMKDILNCKVEYTHSEILKELEKTIQGVTEEREKTEEYMQNIAAVILAPGFVNSEKDPDMDLNTLDMILKRADIPEVYRKLIVERHKKVWGEDYKKISLYQDTKRLEKFYARTRRNKTKSLMARAATELLSYGPSETADEINKHIESMR